MKIKIMIYIIILLGISLVAGCTTNNSTGNTVLDSKNPAQAIIYKSSSCSCCGGFAKYIEKNDLTVEIKNVRNPHDIKDEYNIPSDLRSCHTTIIGDYFVEGHIPIEAINKLMTEKPDIKGIAMSGMPIGSPGMPGRKTETFVITAVNKDESRTEFMRI